MINEGDSEELRHMFDPRITFGVDAASKFIVFLNICNPRLSYGGRVYTWISPLQTAEWTLFLQRTFKAFQWYQTWRGGVLGIVVLIDLKTFWLKIFSSGSQEKFVCFHGVGCQTSGLESRRPKAFPRTSVTWIRPIRSCSSSFIRKHVV